jgi:hypothetical protein
MKEIIINNIKYSSINYASKQLNIPYSTIIYRLKSPNFVNYLNVKKVKVNSGFCVKSKLSKKFSIFFNLEKNIKISRLELTQKIYKYIKDNNLQNPINKRIINPNSALKKLLDLKSNDQLTFLNLQRYLSYSGAFHELKKYKKPKNIIKYKDYKYECSTMYENESVYKKILHKNNLLSFILKVYGNKSIIIECKEIYEGKFELKIIDSNKNKKYIYSKVKLLRIIKKNKKLKFVQDYISFLHL